MTSERFGDPDEETPEGTGTPAAAHPSAASAVAGVASLAAGAIHAAAIGGHGEHRAAVVAFAVVATFQIGWGALALVREHPVTAFLGGLGNAAVVGGFVLAKTSGISFVDGLEAA